VSAARPCTPSWYSCRIPASRGWLILAAIACGSAYEPGVQVELIVEPSLAADVSGRALGAELQIESLRWTSSEVELQRCFSPLASLGDWLIRPAHAHGDSSPTVLAVPTIVSALAAPTSLGVLVPPAGRYCAVRYRVAPADADAVGLSAAPDMLGRSLLLRTAAGPLGSAEPRELASQNSFELTRSIELELSSEHRTASVHLGFDAQRWLEVIDVRSLVDRDTEDAIREAFESSFELWVE
jgi:hypothetical protein